MIARFMSFYKPSVTLGALVARDFLPPLRVEGVSGRYINVSGKRRALGKGAYIADLEIRRLMEL